MLLLPLRCRCWYMLLINFVDYFMFVFDRNMFLPVWTKEKCFWVFDVRQLIYFPLSAVAMNLVVVLSAGRFVFQLCANLVLFSITLFLPSSVTDIRSGNRFGQWNSCMRAAVCNVIVDDHVLCVLFVNVWRNQVWLTLPNVVAIPFTQRNTIASYIFRTREHWVACTTQSPTTST